MSADFPTLAEATAIEQSKASQPALTGSKATLRDRDDGTAPKPPPARSKVRALRDSSSFGWFRRQGDACSFAVHYSRVRFSRVHARRTPARRPRSSFGASLSRFRAESLDSRVVSRCVAQ